MSLIAQFKITLKDFVPDAADGMIIHDHGRGRSMTVSNRLYAQFRSYADDNQLQIGDIVAQLREEVHRC